MKIQISFKTPDAVDDAIAKEVNQLVYLFLIYHDVEEVSHLSPELTEELENRITAMKDELNSSLGRWIKYGENITVELDTTTKEGRVVPVGK